MHLTKIQNIYHIVILWYVFWLKTIEDCLSISIFQIIQKLC